LFCFLRATLVLLVFFQGNYSRNEAMFYEDCVNGRDVVLGQAGLDDVGGVAPLPNRSASSAFLHVRALE
jgi:hypothetical protein